MIEFREIGLEDLSFINVVRNECCEAYLHNSNKFTLTQTIDWFYKTKPMFWIIMFDGERVGYFRTSNYSVENKNIYVGADLQREYRGRGIAYNAYCKFIPFLFKKYDLHKISLEVLSTNIRAIKLYEKIGFTFEGVKRDEVLKNDVWVDSVIMSILNGEFNESV